MSSADQVPRLLAMVPLLQHTRLSVNELAAEFACSPAQIMKDLKTLWYVGPSAYFSSFIDINIDVLEADPTGVVHLGNADFLARPMRLTRSEVSALLVALELIPKEDNSETEAIIEQTITKLREASGDVPAQAEVLARSQALDVISVLQRAIAERKTIDMEYLVASRDELSRRRVDPVEVFTRDGARYLDAWCHQAGARRSFRLDRMSDLALTGEECTGADLLPRERDPADLFEMMQAPEAVIELSPDAAWFIDYHPTISSQTLPDGHLRVVLPLVSEDWLIQQMARLGGGGVIIEPIALAQRLKQVTRRARAQYDLVGDSIGSGPAKGEQSSTKGNLS